MVVADNSKQIRIMIIALTNYRNPSTKPLEPDNSDRKRQSARPTRGPYAHVSPPPIGSPACDLSPTRWSSSYHCADVTARSLLPSVSLAPFFSWVFILMKVPPVRTCVCVRVRYGCLFTLLLFFYCHVFVLGTG